MEIDKKSYDIGFRDGIARYKEFLAEQSEHKEYEIGFLDGYEKALKSFEDYIEFSKKTVAEMKRKRNE